MLKKYITEIVLFIITIVVIAVFVFYIKHSAKDNIEVQVKEPVVEIIKKYAWGFPIDSIRVDTATVKPNQSLSDILMPMGIGAYAINRLALNSKEVFDVRRIKSGNNYYILNDFNTDLPKTFVYEESIIDYVIFDLDSFNVYRGQKSIDSIMLTSAGVIQSSLWNAFVENGASPVLAVELSDIFAWTVDFFGIQNGDQFKVIYDGLYVDEKFAGIGKIHASTFTHMGTPINAYYFKNDTQEGYFDDEGNSLRKAFLKAPLQYKRISSRFSNSRRHPVLKIRRPHHGVDYAASTGTPVYSIGEGTVVKKAYQKGGGGNYINIKHNSVYTSQYMHLSKYAKGMAIGVRVKQGQLIGYVGKTGLATGPHLDFRIYKNGNPVDPLKVKAPPVEPISEENRIAFNNLRDSLATQLKRIELNLNNSPLAAK